MRHDEIEKAVNICIRNYFEEDLEVLLDESILRIKGGIFYIYDLIFFGNKIVLFEETLEIIKDARSIFSNNFTKNCEYLLENIEKDTYGNYIVISKNQYGGNKIQKVSNYLRENESVIYLLENQKLYFKLVKEGLEERIKLLSSNRKIVSLCKNKMVRFETLGFILHKDGEMLLKGQKENEIIKVYLGSGEEKNEYVIRIGDIILLRVDKIIKYSFHMYKIVTKHSRHFAVQIIWTELMKGEKTNFYIQRLEPKYRNIISDNS